MSEGHAILEFLKPGMQTLVQDHGRSGYQQFGVPVGGVVDKSSAAIANWLVGNNAGHPVLEIALSGPSIQVRGSCQIAVTGGDFSPLINGAPIAMYETLDVSDGTVISFGVNVNGCRTYLAIGGSWEITPWLGSVSAASYQRDLMPGSDTKTMKELEVMTRTPTASRAIPKSQRPVFGDHVTVRVLPGPEFKEFSSGAITGFLGQSFEATGQLNRMGIRLKQALPDFTSKREIISSGIIPGTIQVTNSGQPIILLAEAQTSGGYPRIANVISADLDKLGQLIPGNRVSFEIVSLATAHELMAVYRQGQQPG